MGTATYSLDEQNVVHLHYEPESGAAEDLEGPIPATLDKARTILRVVLIVYVVVSVAGFTLGYLLSSGRVG